jgi:hypothetical protein
MLLLMSASWRVNLILALNHSLLNSEYILTNVLKASQLADGWCLATAVFSFVS